MQGSDSVGSLSQSYASKNVLGSNGSTLAVNAGYVVNDGNGGANYTVTTNTAFGTITPAALGSLPFAPSSPPPCLRLPPVVGWSYPTNPRRVHADICEGQEVRRHE